MSSNNNNNSAVNKNSSKSKKLNKDAKKPAAPVATPAQAGAVAAVKPEVVKEVPAKAVNPAAAPAAGIPVEPVVAAAQVAAKPAAQPAKQSAPAQDLVKVVEKAVKAAFDKVAKSQSTAPAQPSKRSLKKARKEVAKSVKDASPPRAAVAVPAQQPEVVVPVAIQSLATPAIPAASVPLTRSQKRAAKPARDSPKESQASTTKPTVAQTVKPAQSIKKEPDAKKPDIWVPSVTPVDLTGLGEWVKERELCFTRAPETAPLDVNFHAVWEESKSRGVQTTLSQFLANWISLALKSSDCRFTTMAKEAYSHLNNTVKLGCPEQYARQVKETYALQSFTCQPNNNPHCTNGLIRSFLSYKSLIRLYIEGAHVVHDYYGSERTYKHFFEIRKAHNLAFNNWLLCNSTVETVDSDEGELEILVVPGMDTVPVQNWLIQNPIPQLLMYGDLMSVADKSRRTATTLSADLCKVDKFTDPNGTHALLAVNVYEAGSDVLTPELIVEKGFTKAIWIGHTFQNPVGFVKSWPQSARYFTYRKDGIKMVKYYPDQSGSVYEHPVLNWTETQGTVPFPARDGHLGWARPHSLSLDLDTSQWGGTGFVVIDLALLPRPCAQKSIVYPTVDIVPFTFYPSYCDVLISAPEFVKNFATNYLPKIEVPIPAALNILILTRLGRNGNLGLDGRRNGFTGAINAAGTQAATEWIDTVAMLERDPDFPYKTGCKSYVDSACSAIYGSNDDRIMSTTMQMSIGQATAKRVVSASNAEIAAPVATSNLWSTVKPICKLLCFAAALGIIYRVYKKRTMPQLSWLNSIEQYLAPKSSSLDVRSWETVVSNPPKPILSTVELIVNCAAAPFLEEILKRSDLKLLMLAEPILLVAGASTWEAGLLKAAYSIIMHLILAKLPMPLAMGLHGLHNVLLSLNKLRTGAAVLDRSALSPLITLGVLPTLSVVSSVMGCLSHSTIDPDTHAIEADYAEGSTEVDPTAAGIIIPVLPGATCPALLLDSVSSRVVVRGPIEMLKYLPITRGPLDRQITLIQHPVPLIKPINNLINLYSLIENRLAKRTITCPEVRCQNLDVRPWIAHGGLISDLRKPNQTVIHEGRYDLPDLTEWMRHMPSNKRSLYANVAKNLKKNPLLGTPVPTVFSMIDVNVKADEKLVGKNKFRPIHAIDTKVTLILGPFVYQISKKLKDHFNGEWFAPMHVYLPGCSWKTPVHFNLLIATDSTPASLSAWYSKVYQDIHEADGEGIYVACAVAGDDNVTLMNWYGHVAIFEADATAFDHSQTLHGYDTDGVTTTKHKPDGQRNGCPVWNSRPGEILYGTGLLGVQLAIFDAFQFPFDEPSEFIAEPSTLAKLLTASYTATCRFSKRQSKTHNLWTDPVTVERPYGERNTGGTDTSIGNSLISLQILVWKVLEGSFGGPLNDTDWYGVGMKIKRTSHPTFLKGIWLPGKSHPFIWTLLPSRLLKMGSTLADPIQYKGKKHSFATAMISSIAKSYCAYPMIQPMRETMELWAAIDDDRCKKPSEQLLFLQADSKFDYELDETEAGAIVCSHYDVTAWQLFDFFKAMSNYRSFPVLSQHPVWKELSLDYLSLYRALQKTYSYYTAPFLKMTDIVMQQRAPRKAQRLLNSLLADREITPTGVQWLFNAVDPFHDTQIDAIGWPDGLNTRSVCSVVRKTTTVTAPPATTTPWDVRFDITPYMAGAQLSGWDYQTQQIPVTVHPTGAKFYPGLSINAGPMGFDLANGSIASSAAVQLSPPTNVTTARRLTAIAFEVHNVTPELYKGGSVTCYRCAGGSQEVFLYNDADINWPYRWTGAIPHDLPTITSLPDSITWEAADGAYVIGCHEENVNPPAILDFKKTVIAVGPPVSTGVIFTTDAASTDLESRISPLNYGGAYFSGLDPNAVLSVTVKYFIEDFPIPSNTDLYVLTKSTTAYDAVALEIYSRAIDSLPVGVPVGENPLGEWFNQVMDMIALASPAAGALFGDAGAAIGSGAAAAARAIKQLNVNAAKRPKKKTTKNKAGGKTSAPAIKASSGNRSQRQQASSAKKQN